MKNAICQACTGFLSSRQTLRLFLVLLFFVSARAVNAGIVGLQYNFSNRSADYCSINPTNGAVTVLNSFSSPGGLNFFSANPLFTDQAAGIAYLLYTDVGDNTATLCKINAADGSVLNTCSNSILASMHSMKAVNGGIVGTRYNFSTQCAEFCSINPTNGAVTVLRSIGSTTGVSLIPDDTLFTDEASGIAYFVYLEDPANYHIQTLCKINAADGSVLNTGPFFETLMHHPLSAVKGGIVGIRYDYYSAGISYFCSLDTTNGTATVLSSIDEPAGVDVGVSSFFTDDAAGISYVVFNDYYTPPYTGTLFSINPADGSVLNTCTINSSYEYGIFFSMQSFNNPERAGVVTNMKGSVTVKRNGVTTALSNDDPVYMYDVITTGANSFVKLILLDKSQIGMGPNGSMRIESCRYNGVGQTILGLIKGKIRAYVEKEYGVNKAKLIIKNKSVHTGVRGTDFEVEYEEADGVATTAVSVFEGIVDVTELATGRITTLIDGESLRILSGLAAPVPSLIGGWSLPDGAGGGSTVTFLANGEYLFFRDGDSVSDPGGQDGMERGTYSWNPAAGTLSATVLADTDGEWGFSHGVALHPSVSAVVNETTLAIAIPGEGTDTFSRVMSPASPLVGSWYNVGGTGAGGVATIAFLADDSYYFTQDGDPGKDPAGMDGGERGSFTWNADTGAFSATASVDTCGNWGLSHLGPNPSVAMQTNNNTLILNGGSIPAPVPFYRVRPFDGTFESWTAMYALFGADADPGATPFAGGEPNLLRYAFSLDNSTPPPGSLPFCQVVDISTNRYFTYEYRVRKNLHGVTLTPKVSTTLASWSPVPAENIHRLSDDDINTERHVVRLPLGSRAFLRLTATPAE